MLNFIQKIQNKPRYIRIQILWLSVFICMLVIVSLWLVSFNKEEKIEKEIPQPSLGKALKATISAFFEEDLELKEEEVEFIKEIEKIQPAKLPLAE